MVGVANHSKSKLRHLEQMLRGASAKLLSGGKVVILGYGGSTIKVELVEDPHENEM